MEKSDSKVSTSYSGKTIAKNTIYNFLGYGVPLLFAIVLIPPLIKYLGVERFGILSLAWMVIGYASFFDFGIGRSLTKIIAEKIGLDQTDQIPSIFWTSLFLMLVTSLITSVCLIFLIPFLVNHFFNISKALRSETLNIFYLLAITIPIVTTTAALRGVLEAYQKFGVINFYRVFLGIFTFLSPLIVLILTNSLFWIVFILIFLRIVIWVLYLLECFKINKSIKNEIKSDFTLVKPIIKLSAWITVANIVGPIILYSDRFLIGSVISTAAITYYATPYEVITKLLLVPTALIGVLLPVFSTSFFSNPEISKKIFLRGVKFIFLILYPITLLIITFSFEIMGLWLGEVFAIKSSLVLQFLAVGVLLNSVTFIPFIFFQGIGKPNIPAIINLIELPFYLLTIWIAIKQWGINGAAFIWMARIIIDIIIFSFFSNKMFGIKFKSKLSSFSFVGMMIGLLISFFLNGVIIKLIFSTVLLVLFLIMSWKYFLSTEEKMLIFSKIRINNM